MPPPNQNTFSIIRSRAGCSDNPTIVQARAALRAITCNEILKPTSSGSNCETQDVQYLLPSLPSSSSSTGGYASLSFIPEVEIPIPQVLVYDKSADIDDTNDAHVYIVGHTVRRVIKCPICLIALTHSSTENQFIKGKSFEGCRLCDPVDEVVSDFEKMKVIVNCILSRIPHSPNLSATILQHSDINKLFCFSSVHDPCRQRVQSLLLKSFCCFLIRVFCTRTNENLKSHRQQTLKKYKKIMQ